LEWRLPEAHAIYWAALGLKRAKENPSKVKEDELIQLRRAIYQSMQMSFHRGRLVADPYSKVFDFGPNLDIVPKVNAAYEEMYAEEKNPGQKEGILRAQRNFLRDAVYFLYEADRRAEANQWYRYIAEKFPDKFMIDGNTNSFPRNLSLDEYATARTMEDVGEIPRDRIKAVIEGMILRELRYEVLGDDARARVARVLAQRIWDHYTSKIEGSEDRLSIPPVADIEREVVDRVLDPNEGWPFEVRAVLRANRGMPPENPPAATPTNAPPATTTNASLAAPQK